MQQKEIALFVDEQLVEMRRELASAKAQCISYPISDVQEQLLPLRIGELKLLGIEFPHPPHVSVDQGFRALAINLLSAPLTIPLICYHINGFRRVSPRNEAMAGRRKEDRWADIASHGF